MISLRQENNLTYLISSHDLAHITEVCERIVVLEKGQIVKDLNTQEDTLKELEKFFNDPIPKSLLVQ